MLQGYCFLEANWQLPLGELDLLFVDGDELVAVEVKCIRGDSFFGRDPYARISSRKRDKLYMLTEMYCRRRHWRGPYRVDVVSIRLDGNGRRVEAFEHLRGL